MEYQLANILTGYVLVTLYKHTDMTHRHDTQAH